MPQRPKREVRDALVAAAASAFADVGFQRATLGDIVERAGTSIGNLYKYFANKDELFAAFMPRGFAADLTQRICAQVEALRSEVDAFALEAEHPYRRASEDLLRFTIEHRSRVVFLLLRAEGTEHAQLAENLVELLVTLALDHAKLAFPRFAPTRARRRALARIYAGFVGTLASILSEERSERSVREAVALESLYHLSGLKAFFLGVAPARPRTSTRRSR